MRKMFFCAVALLLCSAMAFGQTGGTVPVDYKKYPDANPYHKATRTYSDVVARAATGGAARSAAYGDTLPDHVNNALRKFYPPVINQSGGSCGSAQAIYYMMAYEMNSYRNWDASTTDHQLPTHFTWLQTYAGVDKYPIINKHGVPSVTDYGGNTYSRLFGNQDTENTNYGYMQGYDKWYRAMFNRTVGGDIACDNTINTPAGREQLKRYLWNHWGDESFYAGGISGIGVASGGDWQKIPTTPTNSALGVSGKYYVASWGKTYDHALTIVGYDDRIEFDLDGNGVAGEASKDEVGAWIICNSWGSGWCNGGFIYCPYKYSYSVGTTSIAMNSGHHQWRKDYEPKRVFKILMSYDHRSEISIVAGLSADTTATLPSQSDIMPYFNYAGDGTKATPAPAVPMLGRWRTGLNYEPIEFGYDVTDLSQNCDFSKPIKYFLVINSKNTAIGSGHVYKFSLMDYTLDPEGMEIPAQIDSVQILNGGQTTVISLVAPGQQLYEPLNVSLASRRLTWTAPRPSSYSVSGYYVYNGEQKVAEVPSFSHSYIVDDPSATYYVAAAYAYRSGTILSGKAGPARNSVAQSLSATNKVLSLDGGSLSLPISSAAALPEATIEFWINPSVISYQQIGPGWGSFLITTTASGQLQCGWDASNRFTTSARTLVANKWQHVAVVIDHSTITAYVNGMKKGSFTSSTFSGLPAMNAFSIGSEERPFTGKVDELRLWAEARSQMDIYRNRTMPVANAAGQSALLAYYPMEAAEKDGQLCLSDFASSSVAPLTAGSQEEDASFLTGAQMPAQAGFTFPDGQLYAGEPIALRSTAMVNTTSWQWTAPDALTTTASASNPSFTFSRPGTYSITQSITYDDGLSLDSTREVEVVSAEAPVADFAIATDTLGEGELFHFANTSRAANATYTWTMPGADEETVNAVNATATYSKTGIYPVTLTVANSGGTDKKVDRVVVTHSAPRILFSASPDAIMLGETAYLVDDTRNNPSEWKWTVSNGKHTYLVNGQNSSITPTYPGNYSVKLEATNDVGTTTDSLDAALVVYNADSKNGLTFTGKESLLSTADPFASGTRAFTLEWWMCPNELNGALNMAATTGAFTLTCNQDGIASLTIGDKTATSAEGYVIAGSWHHYALTFTFGTTNFYRDGVLINKASNRIGTTTPAWGKLAVSTGDALYSGQIDELRIWSKALSLSTMKNYINAPLDDVETLTSKQGLVAYYDFNQNGGTVKDRTSNGIDLERSGFGPDGDAWGLSRGVFTLDLSNTAETVTVDADGLTSLQNAVAEGAKPAITGGEGTIRFVMTQPTEVFVYSADGTLVFRDIVEGTHYLPFRPGIYIANGVKVRVE